MNRHHGRSRVEIEGDRFFAAREKTNRRRSGAVFGETHRLVLIERDESLEHVAFGRSSDIEERDDGVIGAERSSRETCARACFADVLGYGDRRAAIGIHGRSKNLRTWALAIDEA